MIGGYFHNRSIFHKSLCCIAALSCCLVLFAKPVQAINNDLYFPVLYLTTDRAYIPCISFINPENRNLLNLSAWLAWGGMQLSISPLGLEIDPSQSFSPWPMFCYSGFFWNLMSTKFGVDYYIYIAVYRNALGNPVLEIKLPLTSLIALIGGLVGDGGGGDGGGDDGGDDDCETTCSTLPGGKICQETCTYHFKVFTSDPKYPEQGNDPFIIGVLPSDKEEYQSILEDSAARLFSKVSLVDEMSNLSVIKNQLTLEDINSLEQSFQKINKLFTPKYAEYQNRVFNIFRMWIRHKKGIDQ